MHFYYIVVNILLINYGYKHSPTGLVSKNIIGALKIAVSILLCKLRDAANIIK